MVIQKVKWIRLMKYIELYLNKRKEQFEAMQYKVGEQV